MNIGKSIKVGLAIKEMKSHELAKAVGKTEQTVSYWANGKSDPKLPDVERIADAFGVKVSTFIAWGEHE